MQPDDSIISPEVDTFTSCGNTVPKPAVHRRFNSKHIRGTIYNSDALAFLTSLRSRSASIVFLDPPFNLGKNYSPTRPHLDRKPDDAYHEWMISILDQSVRVLKPGGALFLYHLPIWAMRLGPHLEKDLDFKHWIAVSMKNGFVRGDRLYPAHYALLYYTKGTAASFNRPKLEPATCRHCGGYVKNYGGYTPIIEAKGINLSDFWEDLSPVRHKNTKLRTANELPLKFTRRVIEISGAPGDLYVDPFAGTGSGVVSAASLGLKFRACDIVAENCEIMADRLSAHRSLLTPTNG